MKNISAINAFLALLGGVFYIVMQEYLAAGGYFSACIGWGCCHIAERERA